MHAYMYIDVCSHACTDRNVLGSHRCSSYVKYTSQQLTLILVAPTSEYVNHLWEFWANLTSICMTLVHDHVHFITRDHATSLLAQLWQNRLRDLHIVLPAQRMHCMLLVLLPSACFLAHGCLCCLPVSRALPCRHHCCHL